MFRTGAVCLLLFAACGDLTRVPTPPVPLSALGAAPEASADTVLTSSPSAVHVLRAIPPKALATVHLPDISGMVTRFKKTGLYRLLTAPALKELGLDFNASMATLSAQMGNNPQAKRVLKAFGGEFVFSLIDMQFVKGQTPDVRCIAAMSVRGAETEMEQLAKFLANAAAQQRGIKVEMGSVEGTPFSRVVIKEPTAIEIEFAIHGDALLIGVGRETVTQAITRLATPDQRTILENPSFQAVMKRCGDPRDAMRVHVDIGLAWERFGHYVPKDAKRIIESFGFDKIRSLGASVRFEGEDIITSSLLDSPGGKDFATKLLSEHPVDRGFLTRIPADAKSFSLFAVDGMRLLDKLREALNKKEIKALEDGLASMRKEGVDLERDVFRVFGPRAALVTLPLNARPVDPMEMIWGQLLGSALVVEIQDSVRAGAVLSRLPDEIAGTQRRDVRIDGARVVAYDVKAADVPMDISICYAVRDGYFYLTATQDAMRRLLKPRSPETAKRYEDELKDVPTPAAVISYDANRDGLGLMLQSFMMGMSRSMTGAPASTEQIMNLKLPDLGTTVAYTVADENGIYSESKSPTGGIGSVGGVSGALIMAAIAIPNLHQARLSANQSAAISTMRSLHVAQETYRAAVTRDTDRDGEGEYGFINDLLGKGRPGEGRVAGARKLLSANFRREGRNYVRQGYYFRVYLPADDGSPIGGHESSRRIRQVDGDLAESVMVVVAWPVNSGRSGGASFAMDAAGELYQCESGPYGGDNAPPPDVMSSQEDNLASTPLRRGAPTRDGQRWIRVR